MKTGTLALTIFVAILAQLVVFALFRYYRHKREYRDLESGTGEPRSAIKPPPGPLKVSPVVSEKVLAWEGFKDFVVQRRVMEDGAESACSFYLVPMDGQPLPLFKPGQFLTFRLQIPDPATGELKDIVRCYSLSNRPRSDYYRVTIKRMPPPVDQPNAPPG
ncbi:MAG: FAD/NAD(P)-binding oxidoreductase, partial [Candidatus Thiodiazotropha sp. (ex. Lucinisca nassula)]|nr:FAD/NAD(P)-binding oxidoreductase [Candidatus Thiodiazotropha sp. (ex. Lucinisca nassula)]